MLLITGARTVKVTPLLSLPLTTTETAAVDMVGRTNVIADALQLVGAITVLPNFKVLVCCVAPNPVPFTVTEVPTWPELGTRFVMVGVIVRLTKLLSSPRRVTFKFPFVAQDGTVN